jgi:uncharacterized membrane protein
LLAVFLASFLASSVEFVEASTIVIVIGVTVNWRSSLAGAGFAAAALAAVIAVFGVAVVRYVPIDVLRVLVGILLVLFGLKWMKKAILRYGNLEPMHDEEVVYERWLASMKSRGQQLPKRFDTFGVVTSFKSVLLEGLEVAFIVITFGMQASMTSKSSGIAVASLGAAIAFILVVAVSLIVRAPLQRIPENTLKFVVGIMLTTFGLFWGGEGLGIVWWGGDAFLGAILLVNLGISAAMIVWVRSRVSRRDSTRSRSIEPTKRSRTVWLLLNIYNFFVGDPFLLIFTLVSFAFAAELSLGLHEGIVLVASLFVGIIVAGLIVTIGREIVSTRRFSGSWES